MLESEMAIRTGLPCCPAALYRPALQDRAIFFLPALSCPVLEMKGQGDRAGQGKSIRPAKILKQILTLTILCVDRVD